MPDLSEGRHQNREIPVAARAPGDIQSVYTDKPAKVCVRVLPLFGEEEKNGGDHVPEIPQGDGNGCAHGNEPVDLASLVRGK
jgi:hypothetical protein